MLNISKDPQENAATPNIIGEIGATGAGAVCLWDSDIPQSLATCVPKVDAVVAAIDQVAEVRSSNINVMVSNHSSHYP